MPAALPAAIMFSLKSIRSTAAVLTLAIVAPIMGGCSVAGPDAPPENVDTTTQALAPTPIQVAQAGIALVSMIAGVSIGVNSGQKTQEILDNVQRMQTKLDALQSSVSSIQDSIDKSQLSQKEDDVLKQVAVIDELWKEYLFAAQNAQPGATGPKADPAALQNFFDDVRTNRASGGILNISDLQSIDDLMRGSAQSPGMLKLLEKSESKRGLAGMRDDTIGTYMVAREVAQAKAFFLLREANRSNTAVDIARLTSDQDARMAGQRKAFFDTMDTYTEAVMKQEKDLTGFWEKTKEYRTGYRLIRQLTFVGRYERTMKDGEKRIADVSSNESGTLSWVEDGNNLCTVRASGAGFNSLATSAQCVFVGSEDSYDKYGYLVPEIELASGAVSNVKWAAVDGTYVKLPPVLPPSL